MLGGSWEVGICNYVTHINITILWQIPYSSFEEFFYPVLVTRHHWTGERRVRRELTMWWLLPSGLMNIWTTCWRAKTPVINPMSTIFSGSVPMFFKLLSEVYVSGGVRTDFGAVFCNNHCCFIFVHTLYKIFFSCWLLCGMLSYIQLWWSVCFQKLLALNYSVTVEHFGVLCNKWCWKSFYNVRVNSGKSKILAIFHLYKNVLFIASVGGAV